MSVKEISEEIGINKSSIHHHLKSLCNHGFLQQDLESRKYDIGYSLIEIGQSYLNRIDITQVAHQNLIELNRELNQTIHLFIRDGLDIIYLDKVDTQHSPGSLKCSSYIGQRTDLFSTAAGKVFLSNLEIDALDSILDKLNFVPKTPKTIIDKSQLLRDINGVKTKGFALDLEEHSLGLQCIAIPIYNQFSECIAVLSVSCRVDQITEKVLKGEILTSLKNVSNIISQKMGFRS